MSDASNTVASSEIEPLTPLRIFKMSQFYKNSNGTSPYSYGMIDPMLESCPLKTVVSTVMGIALNHHKDQVFTGGVFGVLMGVMMGAFDHKYLRSCFS